MKSRGTMIVLAVMIVAAFALTSCGGGKATEIKIGGISPLTGEAATFGQSTKNGMELAVEEWNAAGGVLGKQVAMEWLDEKGDVTEALNAYTHGAAYAAGLEDRLGLLVRGYYADLIVLDRDIFALSPDALRQVRPVRVMVNGAWRTAG